MYEIERETLQPLGVLKLPALDLFTEKDWRNLNRISDKYQAKENKDGKVEEHQAALAAARVMAELGIHYDGWNFKTRIVSDDDSDEEKFEKYTADRFITALKESPEDVPINFVYWLASHFFAYRRRLKSPNA